jgi:cytochrome c oxidase subunit 2
VPLEGSFASPFAAHSPQAQAIARLFDETLVVCGVIFAVVVTLIALCIVRFRERGGAIPVQNPGNRSLEVAWTVGPLLIVTGLLVRTVQTMAASDPAVDRAPDVAVIAHQWWWEVRYPSGAVTANEIHVPVGRNLLIAVESTDVIHDFWVPQLARKVDATPGHPTHIWMQADAPGTYEGTCAEYCGDEHAWMRIAVVAQAPADFDAWERHERDPAATPSSPLALSGLRSFERLTCVECHDVGGLGALREKPAVAPDLTHLAERRTLASGALLNDGAQLAAWLKEPERFKPGSHMPNLQLTDAEVTGLVAYLETLR